jgi:hypothetical protein
VAVPVEPREMNGPSVGVKAEVDILLREWKSTQARHEAEM